MKNTVVMTVLKVEGLAEQIDCQVFQDDQLVKSLAVTETQITENLIEFPKRGVLTIVVKGTKTSQKSSVSLNIEALPAEGLIWLPLYYNSLEVLPSVPSMLPTTKVLVSINTLSLLTPVPEMNESDSSVFDIENCLHRENENESKLLKINYEKCKKALAIVNEKNKELRIKYCDLQNRFEVMSEELCSERLKENHESFSKLAVQLEKFKLHCSNLQCINEENTRKIESIKKDHRTEQDKRENIEKELSVLLQESKEYYLNAEKRFETYENIIKSKDEELFMIKSMTSNFKPFYSVPVPDSESREIQELKKKLEESEKRCQNLQTKLETSANFFSRELEDLIKAPTESLFKRLEDTSQELQYTRKKYAELENLLDDKYLDIKLGSENDLKSAKLISDLKDQLRIEREINETLLSQAREKNFKELETKLKGADEKFMEYLRNFCVEDRFQRVTDGVFAYNGKRVSIAVKNGSLVCRVGGGYLGVDKFIKTVLNEKEEGLMHKRSQTSILNDKGLKEEFSRKVSDKKFKEVKEGKEGKDGKDGKEGKDGKVGCKENIEEIRYSKIVPKKAFTKSLTPSRDCLLKRVFK